MKDKRTFIAEHTDMIPSRPTTVTIEFHHERRTSHDETRQQQQTEPHHERVEAYENDAAVG